MIYTTHTVALDQNTIARTGAAHIADEWGRVFIGNPKNQGGMSALREPAIRRLRDFLNEALGEEAADGNGPD